MKKKSVNKDMTAQEHDMFALPCKEQDMSALPNNMYTARASVRNQTVAVCNDMSDCKALGALPPPFFRSLKEW